MEGSLTVAVNSRRDRSYHLEHGQASATTSFPGSEDVNNLAALVCFWAYSYGLVDETDREGRHAVNHSARLVMALAPSLDAEIRGMVVRLSTWFVIAERDGDGARLREFFVSDNAAESRIEHAACELRQAQKALGFDPHELSAIVLREELAPGDAVERAFHWTTLFLAYYQPSTTSATIHSIELALPKSWMAEVNPFALDVEREIETWLYDIGVIRNAETLEVFRDLAVAEYAGWPCPHAGYEELGVIMGFFSLWIFHDDNLEGVGMRDPELLARAVTGTVALDDPALSSKYIRGWAELGGKLKKSMQKTWLQRHHDRFLQWVNAVGLEADMLLRFRRTKRSPSVEDYFAVRRLTVGLRPTVDFVEYLLGYELPVEVVDSQRVNTIVDLMADLLSIHNDFFAFSKDADQSMLNLVKCRMDEGRVGASAFFDFEIAHRNKLEALIEEMELLLRAFEGETRHSVVRWLREMKHLLAGFLRWHALAPRYSDVHLLSSNEVVRVLIRNTTG